MDIFQQHKLQISTRNTYLEITLTKLGLVTELKLSPGGPGYELDGWPTANGVVACTVID